MGTKSRGSFTNTSYWETNENCGANPITTNGTSVPLFQVGVVESQISVSTPSFKKKIKSGQIVNNPFTYTKETRTSQASLPLTIQRTTACGTGLRKRETNCYGARTYTGVPLLWPSDDLRNNLASLAGTEARAEINSEDFMALVELAEARKTISMVGGLAAELASVFRSIRERDFSRVARQYDNFAHFMSANWLRYRYGIMPLYQSANAAIRLLEIQAQYPRKSFRGRETYETSDSGSQIITDGSYAQTRMTYTRTLKLEVKASCLASMNFNGLGRRASAQPDDVLNSLWELTPWSFVIDWFVNAGDWIAAMTLDAGIVILAESTTYKIDSETTWTLSNETKTVANYAISGGSPCSGVHKKFVYERVPSVQTGIGFNNIDLTSRLSKFRALDAIALLQSVTR